jgi:hypothetical protein
VSVADTLLAPGPIDAAALDAWHAALLSWPEFARSDGAAVLMVAGESRTLPQSAWSQLATSFGCRRTRLSALFGDCR